MNYKIKVHSKAESRLVQEHAFKLGAKWADGATYVKNENGRFLYLRDGRITFDDKESYFQKSLCEQISVDDFIELESLDGNIENSRGDWLVVLAGIDKDDIHVTESEVKKGRRFDTEQQAQRAHKDIQKVLNAHQVANALGIDYEVVNGLNASLGEGSKLDRFEREMKRRGF